MLSMRMKLAVMEMRVKRMGYNEYINWNNEPIILEEEEYTNEEFALLKKIFATQNTTRIVLEYTKIKYYDESESESNV